MKIRKNGILALSLALLMMLSTIALTMPAAEADAGNMGTQELPVEYGAWGIWYKFETPLITLIFPAGGKKPMFLWWYTNDSSTIYVVKFQGVIEYLVLDKPYYLKRLHADNSTINATLWKDRIEPRLRLKYAYGYGWRYNQAVAEFFGLLLGLHRAYLPFSACNWTLTGPQLVEDGDSTYWSFNFTLTNVGHGFQFAENNIHIRCRFYNTTTTKVLDEEHSYTVEAGQLKFDFVVSHWEWNIDKINKFLQKYDIELSENRTGLALWVNMASIKIEDLPSAESEVQSRFENQVETRSQAMGVMINDQYYNVANNETSQDEKPLQLREQFRERVRIQFARRETVFAGFLEFVPWARLLDEEGNTMDYVNVTASYVAAGGHLRLFLCYPYFNSSYTLEHDPTIGLASAPAIPELVTPRLLIILVGATVAIAVAVAAIKVRKKPVNIVKVY
jgi:hypothetical protein